MFGWKALLCADPCTDFPFNENTSHTELDSSSVNPDYPCPILCDPTQDCASSPSGPVILQAILEWG